LLHTSKQLLVLNCLLSYHRKNFTFVSFFYQFLSRFVFYSCINIMISVSNKFTVRRLNTRTAVVDEAFGGIFFLFLRQYHMYKNNTKLQYNSCYVFFVSMTSMCSNCSVCILSRYMKSVCMDVLQRP